MGCCLVLWATILVAMLIAYVHFRREGFTSDREKAETIHDWFAQNPSPTYAKYREDIKRKSNIVEYEDIIQ